jgi:predicted transcriptional regulator
MAELGGPPEDQPLYLLDLNVFFDATRKRKATPAAEKIVAAAFNNSVRLYSTLPAGQVVALLTIETVVEAPLSTIWSQYGQQAAISREVFDRYFSGLAQGAALIIRDVQALKVPVSLGEIRQYGAFQPPQFYRRMRAGSPENRLASSELHPAMTVLVS